MQARGLDFSSDEPIPIHYKGRKIDTRRVDFVVEACLAETKAKSELDTQDYLQTLSYPKASCYQVGLLVNFGSKKTGFRRFVYTAADRDP